MQHFCADPHVSPTLSTCCHQDRATAAWSSRPAAGNVVLSIVQQPLPPCCIPPLLCSAVPGDRQHRCRARDEAHNKALIYVFFTALRLCSSCRLLRKEVVLGLSSHVQLLSSCRQPAPGQLATVLRLSAAVYVRLQGDVCKANLCVGVLFCMTQSHTRPRQPLGCG